MRPFKWYKLNVYHVMKFGENCDLVEKHKKNVLWTLALNFV